MYKALDLFCCGGGAARGLAAAGFEVTGVDIEPQPEYPYPLIVAQALTLRMAFLRSFDLIWASPPCQFATAYRRRTDHCKPAVNLIPETRDMLIDAGVPFIIENVTGARAHLRNPIMLCGSMFGLDVQRHRLFETGNGLQITDPPTCNHRIWKPQYPGATNRAKNSRKTVEVGVWRIPLQTQQQAMGLDLSLPKLSQAIPPAYAEWLASRALTHIQAIEAA